MNKTTLKNTAGTKKLILLASLLSMSFLFACSDNGASDDGKAETDKVAEKEKPAIPVEVVKVARGDIQKTFQSITTLQAENEAQVVARSTGLLQDLLVEEGDRVSKGQLLAQLDVEQLKLEVAQLDATSNKLAKELERQRTLFNRKLGSSDALDRAKFEFESQQAQLNLSKLKLRYASIRAPIDGVITERLVKPGNLIRDNDILFKVVDLNSLKAIIYLPEKEMANISKGQPVALKVDALSGEIISGAIERIRPSIDPQTGTFKVVATLDNQNHKLKPGMFGEVEVVFDVHPNALVLKQDTIITQDNRSHVFVIKDDKAIQTPVSLGYKHNGIVEITDGLQESDQIVSTGQQIIKHETRIEIVNQEPKVADKNKGKATKSLASNP